MVFFVRNIQTNGLKWKNINFKKNTITIERTRDSKGTRPPKTKNSFRTIKVEPDVIIQLKEYKNWCEEQFKKYNKTFNDNFFVFISEQKLTPVSNSTILYLVRRVLKTVGLVEINGNKVTYKITPHGLRHTHATILFNNKQNVLTIAKRLGNTVAMIHTIYAHVLEETEHESVAIFTDALKQKKD